MHSYKKKAELQKKEEGLKMKIEKRYSTQSLRNAQPIVQSEWDVKGGYWKSKLDLVTFFNSGKRLRVWEDRRRAEAGADS